jgi:exodeoxyribonuclease VII small subunit
MGSVDEKVGNEKKPIEELTYEQAFKELETIVSALESGDHSLEDALSLFERGQALSNHCADLLDNADLKIKQLFGDIETNFMTSESE